MMPLTDPEVCLDPIHPRVVNFAEQYLAKHFCSGSGFDCEGSYQAI